MFEFLIKKLKAHPRKIVFTEGTDPRILEASARLLSGTFLTPVLVGNPDEVAGRRRGRSASTSAALRSSIPRTSPTWTRWSLPDGGAAQGQDDRATSAAPR